MSDFTPDHSRTVVFPSPLRRSRKPLWLTLFGTVLAAIGAVGWLMTGGDTSEAADVAAAATNVAPSGPSSADSLSGPQRALALTHLAAAELQRGRLDSSDAVLRRLLREHPRAAPDAALFPKALIDRYTRVRASLHGVARIRTTPTGVELIVIAFRPHLVGVGVRSRDGTPQVTLHEGVVRDSLLVPWNGLGTDGSPLPLGSYDVVLIAFTADGGIANAVSFPVVMQQPDWSTPPRPRSSTADSSLRPE